ncbi:MAG TPA: hypothetical protein PKC12_04010 [Thiobacillaceae bacterium]|nr:hypothetical protein [Thiobacillaceae bacterium]
MGHRLQRFLAVVALSLATAAWAAPEGQPSAGGAPKPVISKALKGDQCVEDTAYMRRNHMKVLKHHRDETVLKGIRTRNHSLKGCIDCHASEETGSVAAAKDDFCVSCHSYASVKIDCFDCHSTKPQGPAAMHPLNAGTVRYKNKLAAQATREVSAEDMAGIAQ